MASVRLAGQAPRLPVAAARHTHKQDISKAIQSGERLRMRGVHLIGGEEPEETPAYNAPTRLEAAKPLVIVTDITKEFRVGSTTVTALRHVSFTVGEGQFVTIRGRSGAGKTTLLNLIGGLDTADAGRVQT
jgi:ABC-type glutathione transport system ATPase component